MRACESAPCPLCCQLLAQAQQLHVLESLHACMHLHACTTHAHVPLTFKHCIYTYVQTRKPSRARKLTCRHATCATCMPRSRTHLATHRRVVCCTITTLCSNSAHVIMDMRRSEQPSLLLTKWRICRRLGSRSSQPACVCADDAPLVDEGEQQQVPSCCAGACIS